MEYKLYQHMAYELKDLQLDADRQLYKAATIPPEVAAYKEEISLEELLGDLTLAKLQGIFRSVIRRQVDKVDPIRSSFGEIRQEEVNLADQIQRLEEWGRQQGQFSFRAVLGQTFSKLHTIVTFLAVLELIKMGRVQIRQEELFEDIQIIYLPDAQSADPGYTLTEY